MGRPQTARLGAGALVVATCAVMTACGFIGVGVAPSASDLEAGAGNDGAAGDGNPAFGEGGVFVIGGDSGDDAADGSAPDGAPFTCPSACTSCTGTTCNILCDGTHPCAKPVTCPPGLPCHVTCNATDVCSQRTISCTNATSCRVDCSKVHACEMMGVDCGNGTCRLDCTGFEAACVAVNLNAANAASLCLKCDAIAGNPACMATDGTKPSAGRPCDLVCTGGGCNANGNGLNGCASKATCP
jgi:hypothetical protein